MKLSKRQLNEKKFHDQLAKSVDIEDIDVNEVISVGAPENRLAQKLFADINNKRILDLGCGYGETAVFWALNNARVHAVDISPGMVTLAQRLARKYRVLRRCHFRQMTAERLTYPANYFDFVFGHSILHHTDNLRVLIEVKRVLKRGGVAIFVEPLAYNPLINIYRRIADKVRTPDEKPLTFKDIDHFRNIFPDVKHQEFHLLTLFIFVWFFLVERTHPNRDRYWKKLLKVKGRLKLLLQLLIWFDILILKLFSPGRYLCWNTVIILKK